jgi:hypothetical protein
MMGTRANGFRHVASCGGQLIREGREGFKLMLDLEKHDKEEAIDTLETILARLQG